VKTIIAGSRTLADYATVETAVDDAQARIGFVVTEVLSCGGPGVDAMGERWALEHGVPVRVFHADYGRHGEEAEHVRNGQVVEQADALIAVWDGESPGTADMIRQAALAGLKVVSYRIVTAV
jgi:hypothetical protein